MNFDRNTVIGFIILAVLFFGFFWYNNQEQMKLKQAEAEKARKDSIERAMNAPKQMPAARRDS
ncbi:MAG: hypothetical protein ACXWB9_09955, partial [Flavisolibacter sp.]